ncbi:hypothetical protein CDAR_515181 [Caerostris darwini]|uniref:Uncharacterized protein n=1 Tax=Caerostris darwini TaxID=1538125 RepID=A0AAV4M904_9ARAC|nr:hypothetical protein CDAR_515181 [Caerostris darwini]
MFTVRLTRRVFCCFPPSVPPRRDVSHSTFVCIRFVYASIASFLLVIYLTKAQLLYKAFGGFGDWLSSAAYMHSIKELPPGCIQIPCIPYQQWKTEMIPSAPDFSFFNKNIEDELSIIETTLKKPEKAIKETDSKEGSSIEDNAQNGREEVVQSPVTSVPESPVTDKIISHQTISEDTVDDFHGNKTSEKASPLIQVYVIATGSGGAHTSIGEGGYYGSNNGHSNIDTHGFKGKSLPKSDRHQNRPRNNNESSRRRPDVDSMRRDFNLGDDFKEISEPAKTANKVTVRSFNHDFSYLKNHPAMLNAQSDYKTMINPLDLILKDDLPRLLFHRK